MAQCSENVRVGNRECFIPPDEAHLQRTEDAGDSGISAEKRLQKDRGVVVTEASFNKYYVSYRRDRPEAVRVVFLVLEDGTYQ